MRVKVDSIDTLTTLAKVVEVNAYEVRVEEKRKRIDEASPSRRPKIMK